ncbi:hypothetical protein [uncultured Bacteroides sp.]|uniref:helix-turn-helix transcriptional regulator n=1 Tax=uncultured Bacteroides sp. TaxID=162156 RepID=UPI002AAB5814|nr:hypothetical protein [uncultured Bacteroides sp.]
MLTLNEKDTLSASHYLRNYADILFANNDYQGAIHCIERVLSFHQSAYSPNLFCTAAMCYLSLNKLDSAKCYCNQAKSLLNKNADTEKANSLITCRNLIMGLDAIIGYQQTKKVDLFKMARFNDSIMFDAHNKQLIINEKVSIKNQLEQQNLKLKVNKQHTQLLLIAGLFILVLLAGIIYIYIRNRRIRLIEVEERSETLHILLNDAIKGQTSNQIDSHFFKQILLQQLGLIHIMATNPTNQNQELLKQMARIANKEIPVSELLVWKDLYRVIDSIYDNFYSHLSQRYGNILLEKEMQLCCLLCGEFSTKEISVLTQQSLRTIYQRKTTIRQKLNMDEKEDIVSFLK